MYRIFSKFKIEKECAIEYRSYVDEDENTNKILPGREYKSYLGGSKTSWRPEQKGKNADVENAGK